jgi:hypothetical protein
MKLQNMVKKRSNWSDRSGSLWFGMVAGIAVLIGTAWVPAAAAAQAECARERKNGPLFVTEDCFDPVINQPVVDVDEWRKTQHGFRYRYVNGHFENTETRFSFYFPPQEQYQGRFFHYTLPAPDIAPGTEDTTENNIEFGYDSGAYFVQTNGGGSMGIDVDDTSGVDPGAIDPAAMDGTISGYRADAAAAKYSRVLAAQMYGEHRPYGYRFGGSGGGYKTISGAEHTSGVWDGFLPFVIGTPMTIPNTYSVRAHALRVIRRGQKCSTLVDNVETGGSGDMYAGLNAEERAALTEATRFGFPPRSWYSCEVMSIGALPLVFPGVVALDQNYFTDFWDKKGYLGTDSDASVRQDRVQFETAVAAVVETISAHNLSTLALELVQIPAAGDLTLFDLVVLSGANAGKKLSMTGLDGKLALFEPYTANPQIVRAFAPGDKVMIDNSNFLAVQTYHRHQVPTRLKYWWDKEPGFYVFDQFCGRLGRPLYPQRPLLVGTLMSGTGTVQTGNISGKMMVMQCMMDIDALPWMADWYSSKVKTHLGENYDRQFRLYYIDHADHGSEVGSALEGQIVDPGRLPTHIVRYRPVLEQLLRDLSAWVEQDKTPLDSTRYTVEDGQVKLSPAAEVRKGVQPVVQLQVNGQARAEVKVNEPVQFVAVITTPPHAGKVVKVAWDFKGVGDYPDVEELGAPQEGLTVKNTYTFSAPGTYYPVLRATSQRQGDPDTPWARIENLGRVRVVVK